MTEKEKFLNIIPDLKKFKPNPNNWPIIDKYNYKIYQKNKFGIFNYIEKEIEEKMYEKII